MGFLLKRWSGLLKKSLNKHSGSDLLLQFSNFFRIIWLNGLQCTIKLLKNLWETGFSIKNIFSKSQLIGLNYESIWVVNLLFAQVNFSLAETNTVEPTSKVIMLLLCSWHSGTIYRLLSVEPTLWTCDPIRSFRIQKISEQYVAFNPENWVQCWNQLPHLQVVADVPLIILTFAMIWIYLNVSSNK